MHLYHFFWLCIDFFHVKDYSFSLTLGQINSKHFLMIHCMSFHYLKLYENFKKYMWLNLYVFIIQNKQLDWSLMTRIYLHEDIKTHKKTNPSISSVEKNHAVFNRISSLKSVRIKGATIFYLKRQVPPYSAIGQWC